MNTSQEFVSSYYSALVSDFDRMIAADDAAVICIDAIASFVETRTVDRMLRNLRTNSFAEKRVAFLAAAEAYGAMTIKLLKPDQFSSAPQITNLLREGDLSAPVFVAYLGDLGHWDKGFARNWAVLFVEESDACLLEMMLSPAESERI